MRSGLIKVAFKGSSGTPIPDCASASIMSAWRGVVGSSATSGTRGRPHTRIGVDPQVPPATRNSTAWWYPTSQRKNLSLSSLASFGCGHGVNGCSGLKGPGRAKTRRARASRTGVPRHERVACHRSTVRPSLIGSQCTCNRSSGTGRRISNATRATINSPARSPARSKARVTSAAGGPPCWACSSHGPRVNGVENHPSSVRR